LFVGKKEDDFFFKIKNIFLHIRQKPYYGNIYNMFSILIRDETKKIIRTNSVSVAMCPVP